MNDEMREHELYMSLTVTAIPVEDKKKTKNDMLGR